MAYHKIWLAKDHIEYIRFSGVVTLEDVALVSAQHEDWLQSGHHHANIHYVIDTTDVISYPRNVLQIKSSLASRMQRVGWVLLITDDFFIKHLANFFGTWLNFNVETVPDVVAAYHFLQEKGEVPLHDHWPDTTTKAVTRRQ